MLFACSNCSESGDGVFLNIPSRFIPSEGLSVDCPICDGPLVREEEDT